MNRTFIAAVLLCGIAFFASRAEGAVYAQTGFNDQSGINGNATPNSPYTVGQTVDGLDTGETGWNGAWRVLNGGAVGGGPNAIVKASAAREGDGGLAITLGALGSTVLKRKLAEDRTDRFVVEQSVNFGSVGVFRGLAYYDTFPIGADQNGPVWQLAGDVGSRHFEVLDGPNWEDTGIAQLPGEWQSVALTINVALQTFTFSVDGVTYNSPDPLNFAGAVPQINALAYFDTGAGSLDSIVVRDVPEPAAGGSLVMAGLASLARRRRPAASRQK